MSQFTEKDAEKYQVPLELLHSWEYHMNGIWGFLTAYAKKEPDVVVSNKNNSILYSINKGKPFEIGCNMVNKERLVMFIRQEGFEATIDPIDSFTPEQIIKMIALITTYKAKNNEGI